MYCSSSVIFIGLFLSNFVVRVFDRKAQIGGCCKRKIGFIVILILQVCFYITKVLAKNAVL